MRLSVCTVLVAEDNEGIRFLYQSIIERMGYRAVMAEDGEEAYRLYQHESPDLLLTDEDMPFLIGFQLIRRIREHDTNLPIIMISGNIIYDPAELETSAEVIEAAGLTWGDNLSFDFLSKPVEMDDLVNAIRRNFEQPATVSQNR